MAGTCWSSTQRSNGPQVDKIFPKFDSWPADAQLAVVDLAFQNGPNFTQTKNAKGGYVWAGTRAELHAGDWAKAATDVTGTGKPAEARKRLIRSAAHAKKLKANPAILWNLRSRTHRPGL